MKIKTRMIKETIDTNSHKIALPIFRDILFKEANYRNLNCSGLNVTAISTNLVRISINTILHLRHRFLRICC